MNKIRFAINVVTVFVVLLAGSLIAQAQNSRSFIASFGSDAADCTTPAAPAGGVGACRSISGALAKTNAGGEIDAVDPAEYNPGAAVILITKSITIDGSGAGSASVSSTAAGSSVLAASGTTATDVIMLRGLSVDGRGVTSSGIQVSGASIGKLHIENCVVTGAKQAGILFQASNSGAQLFVRDTVSRNNGFAGVGDGLAVNSGGANTLFVAISRSSFSGNVNNGVQAAAGSQVTLRDSSTTGNGGSGINVEASAGTAQLLAETVVTSNNSFAGLSVGGLGFASTARISNLTVTNNNQGVITSAGGTVVTFGNNRSAGNVSNNVAAILVSVAAF